MGPPLPYTHQKHRLCFHIHPPILSPFLRLLSHFPRGWGLATQKDPKRELQRSGISWGSDRLNHLQSSQSESQKLASTALPELPPSPKSLHPSRHFYLSFGIWLVAPDFCLASQEGPGSAVINSPQSHCHCSTHHFANIFLIPYYSHLFPGMINQHSNCC